MAKYFTSDLHVGHSNICKLTDRGSVVAQEAHDDWIRCIWNSQVKPGDIVYHLGDFLYNSEDVHLFKRLMSQLTGQKVFIKGNHDRSKLVSKTKDSYEWHDIKNIKINIGDDKIHTVLCHFAFHTWDRMHHGSFHLHGHSHGSLAPYGRRLDVGLDNAFNILGEHRFFTEKEVYDICVSQGIKSPDHHTVKVG